MNAVERVKSICKKRGIPIYKLEADCGFSNGYISQLRKGTFPDDRLRKIADYLDLSVEYIMTGKELQLDYLYNDENADFLIEVTKMAKNKDFVERMTKYMSLARDKKNQSIDDMIDFMYEKQKKDEK